MNPATRFAAVAATLTAAHHVGDFLLQTDHQAACKPAASDRGDVVCSEAESWRCLAGHVASYHAAQVVGLLVANRALGLKLRPGRVLAGVAVSAVTHAVIDRRWPVRWWMDNTGSHDFRIKAGGGMHVDQTMHHACLWGSALIIAGGAR
ncbi:DUF3307 domain-containing protein [Nocardiopsis sp. NRRL B-16309]|uniref:DUF3307 domain-containing protein n=1 Tax=Nocardiopsis sp. NRRL B-16309 TaxID=1519494 RepID=UPI0006AE92E7|nr:DUF3307 domain-containing protein [Nocardiopsis sp. NRRL B-16309]KOX10181.1 hypothetical protein ADL05_26270 [Nocardiopsis sp. NRRL B-16309]